MLNTTLTLVLRVHKDVEKACTACHCQSSAVCIVTACPFFLKVQRASVECMLTSHGAETCQGGMYAVVAVGN